MPAFLVELPASGGKTLIGASDSLIVFAFDATDARAMAANAFDGDSDALWNSAQTTVTEIIEGVALPPGFEFEIRIVQDAVGDGILAPAIFTARGGTGNVALQGGAIGAAAGLLYVDDEVATVVGGIFTRAATFRCEGTGAVTAIELMDPGEYTVLPTLDEMATTASLSGDEALTIDGVAAPENSYEVLLGQMVTLLTAHAEIGGTDLDMSNLLAGDRIFILTDGGGGDDLGDSVVLTRMGVPHSGNMPSLLGTIVDEGAANAVLSIDIPDTLVIPQMLRALKSGN